MKIKGIQVEPYDILQEFQEGRWVDFGTIRDESDCHYAEQMINGTHREFKGTFRVLMQGQYPRHGQTIA